LSKGSYDIKYDEEITCQQIDLERKTRGARDVKNCMGLVNFFKALGLTPLPPKKDMSDQKKKFLRKTYVQE